MFYHSFILHVSVCCVCHCPALFEETSMMIIHSIRRVTDENISSFDSTGMFYFIKPRPIEEALLVC